VFLQVERAQGEARPLLRGKPGRLSPSVIPTKRST
jgi:hypothetical protein